MTATCGLMLLLLANPVDFHPMLDSEKAGLLEFYRSTNGDGWKDRNGWGGTENPCYWSGVWCDSVPSPGKGPRSVVFGLSLNGNNLTGGLPGRLRSLLPHLRHLDVGANNLTGPLPEDLLAAWDSHEVQLIASDNQFSNIVVAVKVVSAGTDVLCGVDEDVRYGFEFAKDGKARFESIRCKPNTERETQCLVREGMAPDLVRFSRALVQVSYRSLGAEYDYPVTVATHDREVLTIAWLGDGTAWSLKTHDRQGPTQAWVVQSLFLSLRDEVKWDPDRVERRCGGIE
jgi:hypothetical protein